MPFIETNRLRVHYRTHGDTDGLPMLLVHGSYASSRWWQPFFDILPDAINAVAVDLRGCGASEKMGSDYSIAALAEDLSAFVDALGLRDFDLVGHSTGGAVAVEYALSHAGRLRSLVLVNAPPLEGVFTPLEGLRLLEEMRTDRALLAKALQLLMPSAPPPTMTAVTFDEFFQELVADAQQMAPAAFTGFAEALGRWNRIGQAGRLTSPALLVWGDADPIISRDDVTRNLISIPGANNLEVLRGVGHCPMIEAPVVLAERLIDFVSEDFEGYEEARAYAEEQARNGSDR